MSQVSDSEDLYEYAEVTNEVDQDLGAPPRGLGWEFVEEFTVGTVIVKRWRRKLQRPASRA